MSNAEVRKYVRGMKKRDARERYKDLRLAGWPNQMGHVGKHPELDEIIQEILDEAEKYGIIEELPKRKKE